MNFGEITVGIGPSPLFLWRDKTQFSPPPHLPNSFSNFISGIHFVQSVNILNISREHNAGWSFKGSSGNSRISNKKSLQLILIVWLCVCFNWRISSLIEPRTNYSLQNLIIWYKLHSSSREEKKFPTSNHLLRT